MPTSRQTAHQRLAYAIQLLTAMYRFTRFWNLLLDDHALRLSRQDNVVALALEPLWQRRSSSGMN